MAIAIGPVNNPNDRARTARATTVQIIRARRVIRSSAASRSQPPRLGISATTTTTARPISNVG
ncbi:hypothetical protein HEB94_007216 [Actinopolymorpha pittospori]|uniref:Uncharacterized protein n=1 Tax=Actinopolymorpha pittospori TaxID=648752 RepID=A0A927RNS4_9ACTN|nr:hypothetical protein [Actinopolymorpha pittospori]MBE1610368.1 hypothetical protein [Actinopolymorpha pittospori]